MPDIRMWQSDRKEKAKVSVTAVSTDKKETGNCFPFALVLAKDHHYFASQFSMNGHSAG